MQNEIVPNSNQKSILIQKIRSLAPDKIAEVEDFVDFLSQKDRDRLLLQAANKLAEDSFKKVWGNPEDEDYDRL